MTIPASGSSSYPQYFERSARLTCAVVPSRLLRLFLIVVVLQSQLLLWWCGLPWYLFLPALLLVLAYGWFEWRRLRGMRGRLGTHEGRWFWRPQGGAQRQFEFRGELVLWRWLLVINGRDSKGRRLRLVLARDSMPADEWRRLQGALRFSR